MRRFGRVVAADVEKVTDVILLQNFEDGQAVVLRWLFAHRTQTRGRRFRYRFERGCTFLAQVDEVLPKNSGDAVQGAVNVFDLLVLFRLEDGTDETLVDHHGRTAALGDDHVADRGFACGHKLSREI